MAKLSISISDEDLRWLKRRARQLHRGNLSAAITEQTRLMRHHEALGALLDRMDAPRLTRPEADVLLAEIDGRETARAEPTPKRRKRAA